jgi:hypothetical protein
VKAVFDDHRVRRVSGLETYPQHRYEWNEFHERFPRYTFVPGLYISHPAYEEIVKPSKHKTFYVIRDPRNVVISWYHAMKETHSLMGKVGQHRSRLETMRYEEGITYCIRSQFLKFAFMRTWMQNADDERVLIIKFEGLTADPERHFGRILEHCGIEMSSSTLGEVLGDYTKRTLRQKDLARRKAGEESHYRKKSSDWTGVFTAEHEELFRRINGDLLEVLGYE